MADRSGQQLGNYRLVRLLGRGTFAEVYLGEHRYLKSYAALKVLRTSLKDEEIGRFLSEAQTLVRLVHPNIVRVLEFVVERGTPVLITDYAPGGTARQHHPRGSCLSLATTVSYVKQVAAALQYAHNHNIIHRDVKPENILVGSGQQIFLSDFGIALLAPSPELLSTQGMAGTVPYTAPEQLQGKPTFASDQYALGILAYEWLCGRRPFEGNHWEILHQHMHVAPPPLRETYPELPAEVESVVLRALAKDPQQRFVSVQAFARALERASQASKLDDSDESEVTAPLHERTQAPFATLADKTSRSIFLSASPADDVFAARLQADLEAQGILVEHTPDMLNSEDALRQAIRAAVMALVVISPHTPSSRTVKEHLRIAGMYERQLVFIWAAGDDLATLLPEAWGKSAVIDLIDARENRYELALDQMLARLQQETPATEPLVPSLSETPGEPRNPYKGLRAFTKDDSADFFGREGLIQELAQTIQCTLTSTQQGRRGARLLTVIGPSGSGKSSLTMAGLLPHLQRGMLPGSEEWEYLEPMLPEKHPLESLALMLARRLPDRSLNSILEDLEDDSGQGLHLLATQMVKRPGTRVVLMVDQFEEVFTSTITEKERQQFIDLMVTAVTEPRGPVIVILTLRADFYDRPLLYPALSRLIENHHHVVLPMEIQDLRAIIEQPAALPDVQLAFEGNLVGDLLFEAQGQAGALPLLEFTLDQLFQQRDGHWLTMQAYQRIGGVKGALAKQAELTYASLPSEEHRRLARALFLRLIDPGVTEQDTRRRRATLAELSLPSLKETAMLQQVSGAFLAARLLTANESAGTPTIEVSHEALIREWTRLADWLREAREDIRLQQIISKDTSEWERRGKPRDRLYRGSQLVEAQGWARRNTTSRDETAFLQASLNRRVRSRVALLAFVLLVVLLLIPAGLLVRPLIQASVTNLNDDGPGSLRQAIATASPESTITFDGSLRGEIRLTGEDLNINKSLVIRGPGTDILSIVGSKNGHHKVHVPIGVSATISDLTFALLNDSGFKNEGTLTLIHCVVSHNTTPGNGGGIENWGTLTLIHSTFSGNAAASDNTPFANNKDFGNGGGIANHAILKLTDSTVSGNTASGEGGGIYNDFPSALASITRSTISGNTVSGTTACRGGGGIANYKGMVILTNSTVSGNKVGSCKGNIPGSSGLGGGIKNYGMLTLTNSTISGNTASLHGGGIYNASGMLNNPTLPGTPTPTPGPGYSDLGTLTLINCTVSSNTASGDGGGIGNYGGHVAITFSTIYGNSASNGGGILSAENTEHVPSVVTMVTSIVAGNHAQLGPDIWGTLTSNGYNLIQNVSDRNFTPNDQHLTDLSGDQFTDLGIDPKLQNNSGPTWTHRLLPGSPAIDTIPLDACHITSISTDQRGVKRPDGNEGACDIGAYEYLDQRT